MNEPKHSSENQPPVVKRKMPKDRASLDRPCTVLRQTLEQIPYAIGDTNDSAVLVDNFDYKRIHAIAKQGGFKVRCRKTNDGKIMVWKIPVTPKIDPPIT